MLRACAVLFFLFLCFPNGSQSKCDQGGNAKGSCDRIKDEKFQIRGVKVLPMWKFILHNRPSEMPKRLNIKRNRGLSRSTILDGAPVSHFTYNEGSLHFRHRGKARGVKQLEVPSANNSNVVQIALNNPFSSRSLPAVLTVSGKQEDTPPTISDNLNWATTPSLWWTPAQTTTSPNTSTVAPPVPASGPIIADNVVEESKAFVVEKVIHDFEDDKVGSKREVDQEGVITNVDSSEEDNVEEEHDHKERHRGVVLKITTTAEPEETTTESISSIIGRNLMSAVKPPRKSTKRKKITSTGGVIEEGLSGIGKTTTSLGGVSEVNEDLGVRKIGVKIRGKKPRPTSVVEEIVSNGISDTATHKISAESGEGGEEEEGETPEPQEARRPAVITRKGKKLPGIRKLTGNAIEEGLGGIISKKRPGVGKLTGKKAPIVHNEEEDEATNEDKESPPSSGSKKKVVDIGEGDARLLTGENHNVFESSNIRTTSKQGALKNTKPGKYHYPPKTEVPLPTCFHNPSGYVCCNLKLNNLIEEVYEQLKITEQFNPCNIGKVARTIQRLSQEEFDHPFESIVSLGDFAQNVHFAGDMVCKLELDGKFMLAYATPYNADDLNEIEEGSISGGQSTGRRRRKSLPIHTFRM